MVWISHGGGPNDEHFMPFELFINRLISKIITRSFTITRALTTHTKKKKKEICYFFFLNRLGSYFYLAGIQEGMILRVIYYYTCVNKRKVIPSKLYHIKIVKLN